MAAPVAPAPTTSPTDWIRELVPILELGVIVGVAYAGYRLYQDLLKPLSKGISDTTNSTGGNLLEVVTGSGGAPGGLGLYDKYWEKYHGEKRISAEDYPGLREAIRAAPTTYVKSSEESSRAGRIIIYFNDGVSYRGKDLTGLEMADDAGYYREQKKITQEQADFTKNFFNVLKKHQ